MDSDGKLKLFFNDETQAGPCHCGQDLLVTVPTTIAASHNAQRDDLVTLGYRGFLRRRTFYFYLVRYPDGR
jgi:hypothetical protein